MKNTNHHCEARKSCSNLNRFLSLILMMILLFSALPLSVSAATRYSLTVNGTLVTSNNLTINCGSGTAKFDPNTNTLTLNSAELSNGKMVTAINEYAFIASELPSLHVELIGTTSCETAWNYLLYASGNVTVSGSGNIDTMREEYIETEDGEDGYEFVKSYTEVAVFGDLTFENTSSYRWKTNSNYPIGGKLVLNNSTLTYCDLETQGDIIIRDSTVQGEQYTGHIGYYDEYYRYQIMENATGYHRSVLKTKKAFSVTDSSLLQTNLEKNYPAENVNAELDNVTIDYSRVNISGSLSAKNVTATCTERAADGEYQFEKCTLSAQKAVEIDGCDLQFTEIINTEDTKDTIEMADTSLTDSKVHAYGDLNMDFCKLYGTNVTVDGNLYCIRSIVGANYEGQDSPISVYGDKVDIVNSDFKGIAQTKKGERAVSLGNGIPATQLFDYYTFSGASLSVYENSESTSERTVNLTDSRLLMDKIYLEDADTALNINETRLQLCTSAVNEDNVNVTGNIQIVTGYWNADREVGIFIDFLGDYYTFDEAAGELHLNNDYGAQGWFQIARTYQSGKPVPVTELTDKVKKIVVGDDVTDAQWQNGFDGYKNLKEIEFGDTVEQIGGGYPNYIFRDCTSLESVTIGSNVRNMPSSTSGGGIFASCQKMKKVVIKSEYLIDDANSLKYWFPMKGIDNRYKHLDDLKIYVPANQLQRYKDTMTEYKDQIYALLLLGDTDGNCEIEIRDATFIQRNAAGIEIPFTINKKTADVDGDGDITVMDATAIQYYLANMKTSYPIGKPV